MARARDAAARQARAEQILDAAAELLDRLGYDRVTIEDVARAAGIGRGTVYLHWRTREQLFEAALQREGLQLAESLIAAVQDDPELVLLHRMARFSFEGMIGKPLLRALYRGELAGLASAGENPDAGHQQRRDEFSMEHLRLLKEHGLVADGYDADGLGFAYQSVALGFFLSESLLSPHDRVSADRMLDLLELTVRQAFGPAGTPAPETVRSVQARTMTILRQRADELRRRLSRAYERDSPRQR